MIVFPAIDVLGGRVVRLKQGRFDAVTVYEEDPVEQARRWIAEGAEWLHLVDLDGAVAGEPVNLPVLERVAALGVPVQTGGGVRSLAAVRRVFDAGATRVVLGTVLLTDPTLAREACASYPGVVAGIDAKDGMVAIRGWREGTAMRATELASELAAMGLRHLVYTDIGRDGMQTGVSPEAYRAIADAAGFPVIASGGVSTLADIRALAALGPVIEGVIVGRALYERAFALREALEAAAPSAGGERGGAQGNLPAGEAS